MATNFVQDGGTITLTAPYAVASGAGAVIGSIFGVALQTLASGAVGEFKVTGVWDLATNAADVLAVGAKVYWDTATKKATSVATGALLVGVAVAAKAASATTARVRLNGTNIN
jgi:predicted RecA/RadA family phage recombinase